jgi:hypothetical protein
MLKRWTAGLLAAAMFFNGASMLIDGPGWYERVPGVVDTGPYNPHFVADIGVAFIASAIGLGLRAWREMCWPGALVGSFFLAFHAIVHLIGLLGGHSHHQVFEWLVVVLPAALAAWASTPNKGAAHA